MKTFKRKMIAWSIFSVVFLAVTAIIFGIKCHFDGYIFMPAFVLLGYIGLVVDEFFYKIREWIYKK